MEFLLLPKNLPPSHFSEGETEEVHEKQRPIHYHAQLPRKCTQSDIYTDKHTNIHAHFSCDTHVCHTCIFTRIHTYRILRLNRDGLPRIQRCQPDVKGRQPPRPRRAHGPHDFQINDRHTLMGGLCTGTGTDREGAEF